MVMEKLSRDYWSKIIRENKRISLDEKTINFLLKHNYREVLCENKIYCCYSNISYINCELKRHKIIIIKLEDEYYLVNYDENIFKIDQFLELKKFIINSKLEFSLEYGKNRSNRLE